ncbi:hypothetical protein Y1Q_0014057 [Alligator mississippiensis]|uniref:Secreted protein n=1 Tax=Alligator mississippiensis TaxID=8496 RepID=A0A151NRL0_ALLMI|nr:hypothetical protein Y1Q_0014057 [Alligator mississippiensis]
MSSLHCPKDVRNTLILVLNLSICAAKNNGACPGLKVKESLRLCKMPQPFFLVTRVMMMLKAASLCHHPKNGFVLR